MSREKAKKANEKPIYKCIKCGELCIENVEYTQDGYLFRQDWEPTHKDCGGVVIEITEEIEPFDSSPTSDCFD